MTVKDLIEKAGGLKSDVYYEKAYVVRTNKDYSTTTISIDLKNEMNNLTNLIHRNIRKVRLYDGILSISEIYPMLIQNVTYSQHIISF